MRLKHVFLVTAYQDAPSLNRLTDKLLEYGCTEALNLDGGDTVALAFNNKVILHGNMEAKKLRNLGSMIAFGLK